MPIPTNCLKLCFILKCFLKEDKILKTNFQVEVQAYLMKRDDILCSIVRLNGFELFLNFKFKLFFKTDTLGTKALPWDSSPVMFPSSTTGTHPGDLRKDSETQ